MASLMFWTAKKPYVDLQMIKAFLDVEVNGAFI